MYAEVDNVQRLSPDLLRVVLAGGTLDQFEMSPATDAYINARFLPEASPVEVPFTQDELDGLPSELRPKPRRFTIRDWDDEAKKLSIDFVAHGDSGYAGSWAQRAQPGDRLQFDGPGGSYRPRSDVDWHLYVGDESAFGAIGASLQSLSLGDRAMVFAVVEEPGCEVEFLTRAEVDVRWLYRSEQGLGEAGPGALQDQDWVAGVVASAQFLPGTFDIFVHGEAGEVRSVKRHLSSDRGIDLSNASISPYWRRRHTDEEWRKVKRQWMAGKV